MDRLLASQLKARRSRGVRERRRSADLGVIAEEPPPVVDLVEPAAEPQVELAPAPAASAAATQVLVL